MQTNRVKAALKTGQAVTGPILHEVRSVGMIKLMAAAGHDFVFIDTEHGMYGMETVADLVQMALACGICPLIRPPDLAYHLVARALDTGAQGVIIPRVQTRQEAEAAVSFVKYPPAGRRGAGGDGRNAYERRGVRQSIEEADTETMVILQIESASGLQNVEEIASVPDVDVLLIGPNDLSISMGIPGEYNRPEFGEAVQRIVDAGQKHGVAAGTLGMSGELMKPWYDLGFRFLLCNTDGNMIAEAAYRDVAAIREFAG
jgi:2-keto-3-deoxy-L-rhamnonate aldolase RhmA